MDFEGLVEGRLIKRYKRFLADVELPDGDVLTAHCPNTGAMTGCNEPGSRVWLSVSDSKTRKYPHTWELVETSRGMACIHSVKANNVVGEAFASAANEAKLRVAGAPRITQKDEAAEASQGQEAPSTHPTTGVPTRTKA